MKGNRWLGGVLLAMVCWTQATGCTGLLGGWAGEQPTAVPPTPTPALPAEWQPETPGAVRWAASPACPVAAWYTARTSESQGDLIAWSPDGSRLAFLQRQAKNAWFVGDLVVASGDNFEDLQEPASGVAAWGDLTWAPDGSEISFVALRPEDQLYTVMTAAVETRDTADLFPGEAARTARWSGSKAISGWGEAGLLVCTQCGAGCSQTVRVNPSTGFQPEDPAPVVSGDSRDFAACLQPETGQAGGDSEMFPVGSVVNWSPDRSQAAYPDNTGKLWIYQPDRQQAFALDLEEAVRETKWSPDGEWIAVRTVNQVVVFRMFCKKD